MPMTHYVKGEIYLDMIYFSYWVIFRGDGIENKSSEYISTHIHTWGVYTGSSAKPEVCISYKPPAPSRRGKDGVCANMIVASWKSGLNAQRSYIFNLTISFPAEHVYGTELETREPHDSLRRGVPLHRGKCGDPEIFNWSVWKCLQENQGARGQ